MTADDRPRSAVALPRYLIAALLARLADEGARISLVLLALHRTGSVALGGLMVAGLLIPHVAAAPLVGWLVDRSRDPRRILALAVAGFAASLAGSALLLGRAPTPVVLGILLLGGCCGPAITGGLTSQLPGLVGAMRTPRAFGLDSLFYNVAGMTGPALVGLVALASPVLAQLVLAAGALLGAVLVGTLPIRAHPPSGGSSAGLLAGIREIVRRPALRVVTVASTVGQLGTGALPVVAAVLATSRHSPASSGLLLTAAAAGALIGSVLWTIRPVAPRRCPLVVTLSLVGIAGPLAAAGLTSSIVVTFALFGLSGFFVGPFGSALFTSRSHLADAAVRTQVFTIGAGLKVTAAALGAALVAPVSGLPPATLLLVVAAGPLVAGVVGSLTLAYVARRPAGGCQDPRAE